MKVKFLLKFALSFLLMFFPAASGFAAEAKSKPAVSPPPRISVNEKETDFGKVRMGEKASGILTISNSGGGFLEIREVTTSCGCTAASLSNRKIAAGESVSLEVEIDTEGKVGAITKTVTLFSNDLEEPEKEVKISLEVDAGPHPDFKSGEILFQGKCAGCHIGNSADYIGYALYAEVCAMCHGQDGEGTDSAPDISSGKYLDSHNDEYFRTWIVKGKNGTSMPGFAQENGGPLTAGQIDSLVKTLRDWQ